MNVKLSVIIIIILLLILVIAGIRLNVSDSNELEKPVISLEKIAEDDGTIKIIVTATTNDRMGIKCIVLPDESEIESDKVEYLVTENDRYQFTVEGANGTEESQIIEVTEIEQLSATNPYIPKGFKKVSDNIDEGLIISDENGNQYVWVPVPTGKLERNTSTDMGYNESDSSVSELINSVGKYYGFYMGRYEASKQEYKEETVAASMYGKIPWTDINYNNAKMYAESSSKIYGYSDDIRTSLISSYAWDTTLAWIDEKTPGYSTSSEYGNYTGTIYPTGITEKDSGEDVRQICDLAGNVREWTTESNIASNQTTSNDSENIISKVIRGGGASISRTPISHIGYEDNLTDQYWGFRLVLYKL